MSDILKLKLRYQYWNLLYDCIRLHKEKSY